MNDKPRDCLIEEWNSAQPELREALPALDSERYAEYIADVDYDEERKLELLRTLWEIMAHFVDLSFGVDSVQLCLPALEDLTAQVEGVDETNGIIEAASLPAEKEDWS